MTEPSDTPLAIASDRFQLVSPYQPAGDQPQAIEKLVAVRHWPKGVIPGSIELLGELGSGAQVRLVWHYLPFAPEYSETLQVLSARRRMRLDLPAPSHGDARSTVSLREKKSGVVQEVATTAPKGSAELMWEAFHAFVEKGEAPLSGAAEALRQVVLLREVLATIVEADGRSLEAEPEQDSGTEEAPGAEEGAEAEEPSAEAATTAGLLVRERPVSTGTTATGGTAAMAPALPGAITNWRRRQELARWPAWHEAAGSPGRQRVRRS